MAYPPVHSNVSSPASETEASRQHPDARLLPTVLDVVRQVASDEIMPRYLKVAHSRKADGSLFTEADMAAQEALTRGLRSITEIPVVAEEMTQQEQAEQWLMGEAGLWCIDPIDGTSNFVNGLPYFAVSVALMRHGRPVLGVVYDPVADEAFYATSAGGAFLNGERLPIKTSAAALKNAMAGVDLKRLDRSLARNLVTSPPYGDNQTTIPYGQFSYLAMRWMPECDLPGVSAKQLMTNTNSLDSASLGGTVRGAEEKETAVRAISPYFDKFMIEAEAQGKQRAR